MIELNDEIREALDKFDAGNDVIERLVAWGRLEKLKLSECVTHSQFIKYSLNDEGKRLMDLREAEKAATEGVKC